MSDKIFFDMPVDPELFLAALAVVQDFAHQQEVEAQRKKREYDTHYTFVISPDLAFWIPCLPKPNVVLHLQVVCYSGEYDCAFDFNIGSDAVNRLLATGDRTLAEVWGIMCGAAPQTVPDVGAIKRPDIKKTILIVDAEQNDREMNVESVLEYAMVVGPQGYATYAAAAFGRGVLEFVPKSRSRHYLSKWRSPWYTMIHGDPDPRMIDQGIRNLWTRLVATQQTGDLEIPTAAFKSIVETVVATFATESIPR